MTVLVMACHVGGSYIPWPYNIIGAKLLLPNFIPFKESKKKVVLVGLPIASGVPVGQAWGAVSAASLSADTKAVDAEGQTEAEMNNYIKYTAGTWGVISTLLYS